MIYVEENSIFVSDLSLLSYTHNHQHFIGAIVDLKLQVEVGRGLCLGKLICKVDMVRHDYHRGFGKGLLV